METDLNAFRSEGCLKIISTLVSWDIALGLPTFFIGILSYVFIFYSVFCILVYFIGMNIYMSLLLAMSN